MTSDLFTNCAFPVHTPISHLGLEPSPVLDFSSFRPEPVTQPWTGSHTSPKWLLDSGTCAAESLVTRGSRIRGGAEMARSPPQSHKGGSGSLSPPLARRGSAPLAASSRVRARRACAFRCTSQQPHAADGLVRTRARVTGEAVSPSARAALVRRRQGPSPESALSPGVRGRPPPRPPTLPHCPALSPLPGAAQAAPLAWGLPLCYRGRRAEASLSSSLSEQSGPRPASRAC